jgi:hypothetical protein
LLLGADCCFAHRDSVIEDWTLSVAGEYARRHDLFKNKKPGGPKRLQLGAVKRMIKDWWAMRATEEILNDDESKDIIQCTVPTTLAPGEYYSILPIVGESM